MERLTESEVKSNKYWTTTFCTNAITNPSTCMPNCVTFCLCAWHWCFNATKRYKMFSTRDAGGFRSAKYWYGDYIHEKGSIPKIGSIACWNGSDGHVAFVYDYECLNDGWYNIKVYESNYSGRKNESLYFRDITYRVKVGEKTLSTLSEFQGFLYHPYFREKKDEQKIPVFTINKTYKAKYNLTVRIGPGSQFKKVSRTQLSFMLRPFTLPDDTIRQSTPIVCLGVKTINKNVWMRTYGGWVLVYENDKMLVE